MKMTRIGAAFIAAAGVLCFTGSVQATEIIYDLHGLTTAPVELNGQSRHYPFNQGYVFQIDWSGATLIHDTDGSAHFRDDEIRIEGQVNACVGLAGSSCFGSGDFERVYPKNGLFAGEGVFRFDDVEFDVNNSRTNSIDDVRAVADRRIGELELVGQDIGRAGTLDMGLKLHPQLNYAFRLFDEDPFGDGLYRILSWITFDSWLFAGRVRSETRPGESVFNGDLFACRRGASAVACGGGGEPPAEVPEPMSMLLLGCGLLGGRMAQRRRQNS